MPTATQNGSPSNTAERLCFAAGEYDCRRTWDALIRLNDLSNGGAQGAITLTEDAILPVKQRTESTGLALNFAHNIYLHYVASLFTGEDADVAV